MRHHVSLLHVSMQPEHITSGALRLELKDGRYIGRFSVQASRYAVYLKRRELAAAGIDSLENRSYDCGPDIDAAVARLRPFFFSASYYFSLEPGSQVQLVVHIKARHWVHVEEIAGPHQEKPDELDWPRYAAALTNGTTPESKLLLEAGLWIESGQKRKGILGMCNPDQARYAFALAVAKLHP